MDGSRGAALIDVVVATTLLIVSAAMAVPVIGGTLDRERTVVGARYLAAQVQRARLQSLRRGCAVAVRLELADGRAGLQLFVDGNGNGVLQRDVDRGLDPPLGPLEWLDNHARDVSLRVSARVPDIGGAGWIEAGADPIRIGRTALMAFSPIGSSTSGTLYVAGHHGPQMAIRVFGATGRVRVLTYNTQTRQWES